MIRNVEALSLPNPFTIESKVTKHFSFWKFALRVIFNSAHHEPRMVTKREEFFFEICINNKGMCVWESVCFYHDFIINKKKAKKFILLLRFKLIYAKLKGKHFCGFVRYSAQDARILSSHSFKGKIVMHRAKDRCFEAALWNFKRRQVVARKCFELRVVSFVKYLLHRSTFRVFDERAC